MLDYIFNIATPKQIIFGTLSIPFVLGSVWLFFVVGFALS